MRKKHCGKKNCRTVPLTVSVGMFIRETFTTHIFWVILQKLQCCPLLCHKSNFCIVYREVKEISATCFGGRYPCPWSFRSFPTQTILWLQKGLEFRILNWVPWWEFISGKPLPVTKGAFDEIQHWPAAKSALICVENNAGALLFSLILV